MDKTRFTYARDIKLEAEYTYDKDHNKVYNVKKLRRHFNILLRNLR